MKWKKFLKPDWRKIVILAIFVIIAILGFLQFWSSHPPSFWAMESIDILEYYIFYFSILPLPFILWIFRSSYYTGISLGLILTILFWYLISCLIVWIYDKTRKKK